ncbi:hypothetical protein [Pseudonocardia sp.]|uniref:hypothetical protein n=1 Tax=Pseudonocardia sp. TaxID=60912 RepID=UPI0031FE39DB
MPSSTGVMRASRLVSSTLRPQFSQLSGPSPPCRMIGCESKSRNDKPSADSHPEPGELCGLVDHAMVLAGEVVTLDEQGRPDFGLLQQRSVRCCWP